MSVPPNVLTAVMAAAFCAIHLFVGRLHFFRFASRRPWLSFAGGVAVAYVFMHMLPELGSHSQVFAEAIALDEPLAESAIHALALIGLALFYGTERALTVSREDQRRDGAADRPESGVFWLHIGSSSLLIAIIAYFLTHREDQTLGGLAIYFTAMVLHFATADFGSRSHHPELYDARGRWVLVAATVAGWTTGLFVDLPPIAVGGLFAFVGGGIILTVLKEELPADKDGRFVPFLLGAVAFAVLVLAEEALAA